MATTQLSRLNKIAKERNDSASVTHSKRYGYALNLDEKVLTVLGKDSIVALFRLEQILERLDHDSPKKNRG